MASHPHNTRLFTGHTTNKKPSSLMKYYPASGLTFLKTPETPSTTLLINIDGACPSNGFSPTIGSYGIYFGRNSPFNTSGLLPTGSKTTNNVAEITSAIQALKLFSRRIILGPRVIKEVILISDSAWMVNSLTDYIDKWKNNGWMNSKKQPVINSHLIRDLDDLIEEISMTLGVDVKFWHVKREYNSFADHMANIPLNHPSLSWELFWESQVSTDPQSIFLNDIFCFRPNALETLIPRLLCLTLPITGKGIYISSLRTFLILQTTWKVNCLPQNTYPPKTKEELRDTLLKGILGPHWRRRANTELNRWKGKIETQTEILHTAIRKFHEEGNEEEKEKKGKFVVRAEVANHEVMRIICRSLAEGKDGHPGNGGEGAISFEDQDTHYASLSAQYLGISIPQNTNSSPSFALPKPVQHQESDFEEIHSEEARSGPGRKVRKPRKGKNVKKGSGNGGESSGVRLVYGDDWEEIEYPSS